MGALRTSPNPRRGGAWGPRTWPLGFVCLLAAGCHIHAHYHAAPRQEAQEAVGAVDDLELTPTEKMLAELLTGADDG